MTEDGTYAKILRATAADRWGAEKVRAFTKWWLDLMRNLVVVAFLLYLARKTDSRVLNVVAYASFGAVILYRMTYTAWWFFNPLHRFEGTRWWIRMATYQIANAASLLTFWFVWLSITNAIDAISKAQGP